jgi:Undecaprenyl-phosphate glucose phosphotransferase
VSLDNAATTSLDRLAGPLTEPSAAPRAVGPKHAARLFAIADFATIALSGLVSKLIYLDLFGGTTEGFATYAALSVTLALMAHVFFRQMGLYDHEAITAPLVGFGKVWGALLLTYLTLLGALYIIKQSDTVSRGWVVCWLLMSAIAVALARSKLQSWLRRAHAAGRFRKRTALYGDATLVAAIADAMRADGDVVDPSDIFLADGSTTEARLADLKTALLRQRFDRIIVAVPPTDGAALKQAVCRLSGFATELDVCTTTARPPVATSGKRRIGGIELDIVNTIPASERSRVLKAALDYTVAGLALVLLLPLFAAVAIAIKLDSRGPVFFRQRRYGQNGQIFRIFKFRTMSVTEDGPVVTQAVVGDTRVTRVGRFLRMTSIDELPQLLNVLLGDMSLVGPRPHALAHDDLFEKQLDQFSRRRRVLPGLTGWAQVNGFRGETRTTEDVRQRMNYDLYYVDNWSIWLDIEILARTVFVVARGAH